jgi:serine O-acetyltransferase
MRSVNPRPVISDTDPDWAREVVGLTEWNPGKQLLAAVRLYARLSAAGAPKMVLAPVVAVHRFWSAVSGADIPLGANIGGGLVLPHPTGIVVHPDASIGVNCLLFQGVTVGYGPRPGLPTIAGHVDVGAGAKILGGVYVGAHAKIGANAVVLDDVPSGATAVGIPARVVRNG